MALLFSCSKETIRVSDRITEVALDIKNYSGIKVSDAFTVFLDFDNQNEGVVIEANENIQNLIIVQIEGDYLRIKLKENTNIKGDAVMNIYLSKRTLNEILVAGASQIILNNTWNNERSKIELSGASNLVGEVTIDELELLASGASNVDLYGNVMMLRASLQGSSNLKDYDLNTSSLEMILSGASNAYLGVSESIKITASGASVLTYKGSAVIEEQNLSGSSQVRHTNTN